MTGTPKLPAGQARESTELAEQALGALEAARRQSSAPPAPVEGTDDDRHVTIEIGPAGLTGCTIDPRWAARRDGAAISAALSSALKCAAAKVPAPAPPSPGSNDLLGDALAGLAFYTVLAGVLVKLILATATAVAAFGSAVFSPAGTALLLEEAGVNTAVITTAVAALGGFLAAQATAMITLHGDAIDPSAFPGGTWPKANSGQYDNASVKDGDADWSLQRD